MKKILITLFLLCGFGYAANEIRITGTINVQNGNFSLSRNVSNQGADQRKSGTSYIIQHITTNNWVPLTIVADVTTNGWCWMRLLTTNGYCDIGASNYPVIRLTASDPAVLRLHPTNILYAIAGTTNIDLEFWVNQD